jgi:hypothetical protein
VVASYTDGQGATESVASGDTAAVANFNDAPSGVPTISGIPTENQTLTVETVTIGDADGLGAFSYQWLRNGVAVGGATSSTYVLSNADVGSQMSVQLSYTDGHGTAEALTSAAVGPVAKVMEAPVARADEATTAEDTSIALDLIANDGDSNGDGLTVSAVTQPAHGTVRLDGAKVIYTPAAEWSGRDSFSYTVVDGKGGASSAGVSITVTPVNDAPTMTGASIRLRVGETVVLTTANVAAHDVDDAPESLVFAVRQVSGGRFEVVGRPAEPITAFSYADLIASRVRFVHDGSAATPAFTLAVSDAGSSSAPLRAQVTFDAAALGGGQLQTDTGSSGADVGGKSDSAIGRGARSSQSGAPPPAQGSLAAAASGGNRTVPALSVTPIQEQMPAAQTSGGTVTPVSSLARILLDEPTGGNAEIEIVQGILPDEYLLRLVSIGSGETRSAGGGRELGVGAAQSESGSWSDASVKTLSVEAAEMIGISLTAGAVWWAWRMSGLVSSLLASLPAWCQLDLLPILPDDEESNRHWSHEGDEEASRDENAVGDVIFTVDDELRR